MIRPAPADRRLPGAPIAAILPPSTPISAACTPDGRTAVPPVTTRSNIVSSPLTGTVVRTILRSPLPTRSSRRIARRVVFSFACVSRAAWSLRRSSNANFVQVQHALADLELLTTGLLPAFLAAGFHHLRELAALSRCGGNRDDQSYRHSSPRDA